MQTTDTAMINVQLSKRGDIDAQIDAYKARIDKQESIERVSGVRVLCKGGFPRVFANLTQAEKSAARTGGEAFKSLLSNRFMVRFA